MSSFHAITPEQLNENPFNLISKDWALITAGEGDHVNAMTASWGGVGVLWGRDVAFIFIRPQRYTKEFVDRKAAFSLTFFPEGYREKLNYLGTVSGRDENKILKSGLTLCHEDGIPYFEESKLAIFCKKLYAQPLDPVCFLDAGQDKKWYPKQDYHTMYVGEITKIMQKA